MTNPTGGIIKIQITRLTQNFCLFQDGEYLVACPVRFLLLYLIHRSLFLFRLSFPHLPFVIPVPPSVIPAKAGIQEGLDPQSEALRFRLRMTKNVSFPQPSLVIPVKTGIQSVISGSPIRSALLSVEDDKRLSVEDDKGAFG